jgi:hypothetical protein
MRSLRFIRAAARRSSRLRNASDFDRTRRIPVAHPGVGGGELIVVPVLGVVTDDDDDDGGDKVVKHDDDHREDGDSGDD